MFSLQRVLAPGSHNPQRARLRAIRTVEVGRSIDLAGAAQPPLRRVAAISGVRSVRHGVAALGRRQCSAADRHGPVSILYAGGAGTRITLERNPDYWGPPALLRQVTFKFITDPTAAYAALMAGDVDAFSNYPAPESFAQFAA